MAADSNDEPVLSVAGCEQPDTPAHDPDDEIAMELGASGAEVVQLHQQLAAAGFLPNDELSARFPGWRAPAETPAQPDVFDERTATAVSAFQRSLGLDATGIADPDTLERLSRPRCGTPDGAFTRSRSNEKFALYGGAPRPMRTNTYKFMTCASAGAPPPSECTFVPFQSWQKAAVRRALATWSRATSLTFTEETSLTAAADLTIHLVPLSGNTLGHAHPDGWLNLDSRRT